MLLLILVRDLVELIRFKMFVNFFFVSSLNKFFIFEDEGTFGEGREERFFCLIVCLNGEFWWWINFCGVFWRFWSELLIITVWLFFFFDSIIILFLFFLLFLFVKNNIKLILVLYNNILCIWEKKKVIKCVFYFYWLIIYILYLIGSL